MKSARRYSDGDSDGRPPKKRPRKTIATEEERDLDIPLELWLMIFERLHDKADLQSLTTVCKKFNELISECYHLWYRLRWPVKNYRDFFINTIDTLVSVKRAFALNTGDVAVFSPDGSFRLLPVMGDEWVHFAGHLDPTNFHAALPSHCIVSLHRNQLATCAKDGIRIWERLTGKLVQHLPPQQETDMPFEMLATSNNGLISASLSGNICYYSGDKREMTRFKYDREMLRGKLKEFIFWGGAIVAEFESAIVSWSLRAHIPRTNIIIPELKAQLNALAQQYINNQEMLESGQITPANIEFFSNPANESLKFDWEFGYWNSRVEVELNKTFSFLIDIFNSAPPIFLGVYHNRCGAHDRNGNYSIVHRFGANTFHAYLGKGSQEAILKFQHQLLIEENVKCFFVQPSGHAFFLLFSGAAIKWDIQEESATHLVLQIPENTDEMDDDFFNYANTNWRFKALLDNELIGFHKHGYIIIWDMSTGEILQEMVPNYLCDSTKQQHVLQEANGDIIIQQVQASDPGENNPKTHICVHRFLSSPLKPPQALVEEELDIIMEDRFDFDILPASPRR